MIKYQCSGWLKYKKGSSDLRGFTYTYDASGNITKIVTEGTNVPQAALTKEYTYDALGQLATEVNGSGTTFGYAYDTAGNIRSITKDGTVTKSFGYTNPSWPDLLTSVTANGTTKDVLYEGQSQTSDLPSSGNPVTYYNGKDYTFTWTKGRQLASATVDGKQVSYTYDMSGVRTSKTVNGTTYNYTTLSGKVMRQSWGNKFLEFVYDDGNQPFAMIYNDGSTSLYWMELPLNFKEGGEAWTSLMIICGCCWQKRSTWQPNCRNRNLRSFISSIAQAVRCIVATIVQA